MTDSYILNQYLTSLKRSFPDEVATTIAETHGRKLTFADTIATANDDWQGGVVEFLTGACAGFSFTIANSDSTSVYLRAPSYTQKPEVGDSVRLYGGPLDEAKIFQDDPESILAELQSGVKYFLIGSILTGSEEIVGVSGRGHIGMERTQFAYGFRVIVETKLVTGIPSVDDMWRQYTGLPLFKDQIVTLTHAFRHRSENRLVGDGALQWSRGFGKRTGQEYVTAAYVIDFDVVSR